MIEFKKWQKEDVHLFYELSNCHDLYQNMNDSFPKTIKEIEIFLNDILNSDEENVCIRKIIYDGQVVGSIGIFINDKQGEIAYWLNQTYWGQGIMSQVICAFIEWIQNIYSLYSIIATPFSNNKASQRVLEKSGFVYQKTLLKHILKDHCWRDCELYVLNIFS
ncbi:GNAT family N-acetyltransferase [Candidatus Stoquefichus massiliensis]|uniref:GNAT family N-acetyltransferase n=1 Tax=Candidatus Stoquefichus massiliensis TaxID=1470350 RepID=UPI0004816A8D|nr:GNAT family protein [Candidatus Stoquefichus massiliensis]